MKYLKYIILILILSITSCGKKNEAKEKLFPPQNLISSDEMKNVLVDVFLAEGAIGQMEIKHKDNQYYAKRYYNYVLKRHNITNEQFQKNYSYYSADIEEMQKIMSDVIDDLSEKQSKVRNE